MVLFKQDFYQADVTPEGSESTLDIWTGLSLGPLDNLQKKKSLPVSPLRVEIHLMCLSLYGF